MNLMDGKNDANDPINPWIKLASSSAPCNDNQEDTKQAFLSIKQEEDAKDILNLAHCKRCTSYTSSDNEGESASHFSSLKSFSS